MYMCVLYLYVLYFYSWHSEFKAPNLFFALSLLIVPGTYYHILCANFACIYRKQTCTCAACSFNRYYVLMRKSEIFTGKLTSKEPALSSSSTPADRRTRKARQREERNIEVTHGCLQVVWEGTKPIYRAAPNLLRLTENSFSFFLSFFSFFHFSQGCWLKNTGERQWKKVMLYAQSELCFCDPHRNS